MGKTYSLWYLAPSFPLFSPLQSSVRNLHLSARNDAAEKLC